MSYSIVTADGAEILCESRREIFARALAESIAELSKDDLIVWSISKQLANSARARHARIAPPVRRRRELRHYARKH